MGFVDDQKRASLGRQRTEAIKKAGVGQHHAGVGHHRLCQDRGHVALGDGCGDGGEVVEFAGDGGLRQVGDLPQQAGAVHRAALVEGHEDIIHRAVIAAVEHEHLGPPCHRPRNPQRKAVGVGRRRGDLPTEVAEGFGQEPPGLECRLGGQHVGQALPRLPADRFRDRRGGMAEHRPGIAQAEIVDPIAVDVGYGRPLRLGHQRQMRHRPIGHPVHRHAIEKDPGPPRHCGGRGRAAGCKAGGFAGGEGGEAVGAQASDRIRGHRGLPEFRPLSRGI